MCLHNRAFAEHPHRDEVEMTCDDDLQEVDLQILKEKIEECIGINADPKKIKEVHVRVN